MSIYIYVVGERLYNVVVDSIYVYIYIYIYIYIYYIYIYIYTHTYIYIHIYTHKWSLQQQHYTVFLSQANLSPVL